MPKIKNNVIDGNKKCNICGISKPVTEYYFYKMKPRSYCKSCGYLSNKKCRSIRGRDVEREYERKALANPIIREKKYEYAQKRKIKNKKEFVEYKGGKCEECGYDKCIYALEFHHVEPHTKNKKLSKGRGIDTRLCLKKVIQELDKCKLLCSNCHREAHYEKKC